MSIPFKVEHGAAERTALHVGVWGMAARTCDLSDLAKYAPTCEAVLDSSHNQPEALAIFRELFQHNSERRVVDNSVM